MAFYLQMFKMTNTDSSGVKESRLRIELDWLRIGFDVTNFATISGHEIKVNIKSPNALYSVACISAELQ